MEVGTSSEEDAKMRQTESDSIFGRRQDVVAWVLGIVFITMLEVCVFGFGTLRGWDADSGWTHNESTTSQDRFLPEPFTPEEGVPGRYGADASGRWYYWKLPPDQATAFTRLLVWACYICHQLLAWACIFYGQKQKLVWESTSGPRYSGKLEKFNYMALIGNATFHLIHLGQTHWTYDATAQDVSVASSQSSVIMLIVLVLVLEYRDRGLVFGWPTARNTDCISRFMRLPTRTVDLVRKYHGYAFAWAAIYTFWYHPMENTWGHAMGFFHTFIIMLQGSLIYTKIHRNRYWRLILESWVILHGSVVAAQTGGPLLNGTLLWPMFCFGFLWLFTMTQLYGLPFWKKLPVWTRPIPFVVYLACTIKVYSTLPDQDGRYWIRLNEIIRIPAIEYLAALFTWVVIEFFLFLERKVQSSSRRKPLSATWEALYIMCVILVYAVLVTMSALIQVLDLKMGLIMLMIILVFLFIVGVSVTMMLTKQCFRRLAGKPIVGDGKKDYQATVCSPGGGEGVSGVDNKGEENL